MDDMILCIGTGISGKHPTAPVYTVLTQRGIAAPADDVLVNGATTGFPYSQRVEGAQTLFDGHMTGYLVMDENAQVVISKREQVSRGDECTFDEARRPPTGMKNGKPNRRREPETRGNFLAACIDHGVTPEDARYSYIVFPSVDSDSFKEKAQRVHGHPELFYRIISSKDTLHAVRDVRSATGTYICYEAQDMIPHAALHSVSDPSLLIFKDAADGYTVSAALPDLHQTAFSREHNYKQFVSRPHDLKLVFDGAWALDSGASEVVTAEQIEGQTVVTIRTQHGATNHFKLNLVSQ